MKEMRGGIRVTVPWYDSADPGNSGPHFPIPSWLEKFTLE